MVLYSLLVRFLLVEPGDKPVDPQNAFITASIACGLASTCVVLSLWSFIRLSKLEGNFATLDDKLPPQRIRELEQGFDAMTDAFEGHQKKNLEWKQSVHNSVQRMDQIMRRNEEASTQVIESDGSLNEDIVKGELPAGLDLQPQDEVALSKQAALRLRYNRNRGMAK